MRQGETIRGRYRLQKLLGSGRAGSTWQALDLESAEPVAVKALELARLSEWKDAELFEREASVLRILNHERIPRYIDYFTLELEGHTLFVLVQQYIPGESLQAKIDSGWRATEEQIRDIGARILRILAYIHSLRPPIVHRDINPRNLIRREDGEIFLVDFGGVQDALLLEASGSTTVIGTPGYVPMEQYMGRATVRSDLYAFAATLLALLTHRNPADFPLVDLKIDFSGAGIASRELSLVLAAYLEPDEAKRTLRIEKAIDLLEGKIPPRSIAGSRPAAGSTATGRPAVRRPTGSKVEVSESADGLVVRFTQAGRRRIPLAGFTSIWIIFILVWDIMAISLRAPIVFPLFSLPFWAVGLFMLHKVLYGLFGRVSLEFSLSRGFRYVRQFLGRKELAAPLSDVGQCVATAAYTVNNVPQYVLELEVGTRTVKFGEFLAPREKEWLADLINRKVEELASLAE
jgi:serine/threonine protein kinase